MGSPAGVTDKKLLDAAIARFLVPDSATFIIADAVEKALRDPEQLRREYGIATKDWQGVLKRLRAFQALVDPHGDWR